MEVHPPEHGIHNWRDFFVHMGTIVLGLLIAIGLEQTVEHLHHRSELRELQEALEKDAERNVRAAQALHKSLSAESMWLKEREAQTGMALRSGKPVGAAPARLKADAADVPTSPAWTAAKASGFLAFVPEAEIKSFSEIDGMINEVPGYARQYQAAYDKRAAFEAGVCGGECGEGGNMAGALRSDLRQYITLLEDEQRAVSHYDSLIRWIHNAEEAVEHGERELGAIQTAEHRGWEEGRP